MARVFVSGNVAVGMGAIAAGCRFFAGYPITPASDLMEFMARELPARGGVFFQAEDEIAAINMVVGASWAGARAMTATSGPGFSLMQEGIGLAVMTETPIVVVDVMRAGPATGQATKSAQGDVLQARWGRHGDQMVVVYAPSSPHDCFRLTVKAFNVAEMLRVPVIVLSDELVAHTWETVELPDEVEVVERPRPRGTHEPPFGSSDPRIVPPMPPLGEGYNVLMTGSTHDEWGVRRTQDPKVHDRLVQRLVEKVRANASLVVDYERYGDDDPEVGVVAYGSVVRPCIEALDALRSQGVKAALMKLGCLWPLPEEELRRFLEGLELVVVPEMNLGQLVYDVERLARGRCRVVSLTKIGGGVPIYAEEVVRVVRREIRGP